ncbi:MAG: mechanosensitive ion channel family protein, partial [Promethearchaeota archaeon]
KIIKAILYIILIVIGISIYFLPGLDQILLNLIILNILVYIARTIFIDIIESIIKNILTKYISILIINIIWLVFIFSLIFYLSPTYFIAIISFLVVAISLTFQNIINNIASGIMLLSSGGFEAGDYLEIGGIEGRVQEITLNHIKLISFDGSITYIPNKNAFNASVTKYTHRPLKRDKKIDLKATLKKVSKIITKEEKITRYVKVLELMNNVDVDKLDSILSPIFDKYEEIFGIRPYYYANNSVTGPRVRLSITLQILTKKPELILSHTDLFLRDIVYEIYKDEIFFGWNNNSSNRKEGNK